MLSSLAFAADPSDAGQRLDLLVLSRFPTATRAAVREAIRSGGILLCGRKSEKGARVKAGDEISILSLPEASDNRVRPDSAVAPRIVFDDGFLVAADKPCGMAVQPLAPDENGTLAGGMVALRPQLAEVGDESLIAGAVHRIDAGTSGLVLFALSNDVFSAMRRLFAVREVEKKYLALVEGAVTRPGAFSCELAHAPRTGYCRMVEYAALPAADRAKARPLFAETGYRPLRAIGGRTLLEVTIRTGVTHQIRAQLALSGHPIAGDAIYGGGDSGGLVPRGSFCLHSLSASFAHPATGAATLVSAPPPPWIR